MANKIELWKEKYSNYIIFIYFILLILIAFGLNNLFADSRDVGYMTTNPISHDIKLLWYSLITFCFGAFYGITIIVAWFDWTKRLQSILILVSSVIVITAYSHIVTLRPLIFFIGLPVGAFISQITINKKVNYGKYKISTIIISIIASIIILLTLLNYIAGKSKIETSLLYFLLTSAFYVVFYKFATYPVTNCRLFIIGRMHSGKTVFIIALYEKALQQKRVIDLPSPYLADKYGLLFKKKWPPANIDDVPCNFSYVHGRLFTQKINIDLDYSGERLVFFIDDIINYLKNKVANRNIQTKDKMVREIGDGIFNADKLIFLIDPQRIGIDNEKGNYLNDIYIKILETLGELGISKPYYLVITKADKLYDGENLPERDFETFKAENYDIFRRDVICSLDMREPFFRVIKNKAEDVLPVLFFEDNRYPGVENGDFKTIGFDKVLEVIGK